MKTIFKILSFIIIVGILGFGVYFALKHTDNFSSDLKTFYVEYENHHLASENDYTFQVNTTQRFDMVYTFDFIDKEQKGYSVKVVPNSGAEAVEYVIDDKYYLFSALKDITAAFDIKCEDTYFTLSIPRNFSITTVLTTMYPDKTVEVEETYTKSDEAFYTLIITSYDGANQCKVNFGVVDGLVSGVTLSETRIVF